MASIDPKTKTTYATTDWDHYRQGRPPYPPSLTEIIYAYRRRHPNVGWSRLVDVGAGSGIASTNFMPDFKIVHNSDPSPGNEAQARSFLSDWAQSHGLHTALEYSQSTGEEAYTKTGEQQADMVICATAAHFMDPDGLVASCAKILRPGGTLAVFSYWMPTFPDQSQRFHDLFANAFDNIVLKALQRSGDDSSRARLAKVVERRISGKGSLDSLPLPEDSYVDPLRVYINSGTGEKPYNDLFLKLTPADSQKSGGISRVSSRDRIARYRTGVDAEAEGWAFQADKKWLSNFFDTIRPKNSEESEEAKKAYAEWERVFEEECPAGSVRVQWPAYVALATRK